ncbi:MAG: homoserine kinase [Actinobacteria bacterium]|nr:homoserine kinase [Actinomycetota bacterium]MCG2802119.1 homoserine kinase [Cellulomonas sp.]
MRLAADRVRVRVPATSANLGPGYDAMGLALALYDEVEVTTTASSDVVVEVAGECAGQLPSGDRHLVAATILDTMDEVGVSRTGLRLRCTNVVPHGRGLGSSAAAVVAGILAVRGLIAEPDALDDARVLALATRREGHPDNAAPAVFGGLTLAWLPGPHAVQLQLHESVRPVVAVPPTRLATATARKVLPARVPHADAAFQLSRAALLVEALGRHPELLFEATVDRLHQEQRRAVMPDSLALVDALRRLGVPAVVSGAGPTVLAFGVEGRLDARAAMHEVFGGVLGGWRILAPEVDRSGGTVERF